MEYTIKFDPLCWYEKGRGFSEMWDQWHNLIDLIGLTIKENLYKCPDCGWVGTEGQLVNNCNCPSCGEELGSYDIIENDLPQEKLNQED